MTRQQQISRQRAAEFSRGASVGGKAYGVTVDPARLEGEGPEVASSPLSAEGDRTGRKHLSPGALQIAILRTVAGGSAFLCTTSGRYQAALRLHERGLLDRDLRRGMSRRFIGNEAGERFIIDHDARLP